MSPASPARCELARRLARFLRIALPVLWTAAAVPAHARGVVEISDGAGLVGPQVMALSADGSIAAGHDLYAQGFRGTARSHRFRRCRAVPHRS